MPLPPDIDVKEIFGAILSEPPEPLVERIFERGKAFFMSGDRAAIAEEFEELLATLQTEPALAVHGIFPLIEKIGPHLSHLDWDYLLGDFARNHGGL